jgi:hypothetical protein
MPKFRSPLGDKEFSGPSMRELDVPDESEQEMAPAMRMQGPALHGPQEPIDIRSAMEYQQRLNQRSAEDDAEIERQFRAAREAKRTGKERLNEGAKRRIEMLIGMTRHTKEFEVGDTKFAIQTLRSSEMRESIVTAAEFDGTVQFSFEIRRQLLARAITAVADVEIEQFLGSNNLESKLQFIDLLDESLLNRVYAEYLALVNEAKDKFSIKTPEEAKEVVEDLKK